jgi:hypothetical protein
MKNNTERSAGSNPNYRVEREYSVQNMTPGERRLITSPEPAHGETPFVATVYTRREEFLEPESDLYGLDVIDMRSAALDPTGRRKVYDNQFWAKDLQYLLVQRANLDVNEGRGYKGLRLNEEFTVGRNIPAVTKRFKMDDGVSRQHAKFEVTQDGSFAVTELRSSNGTSIGEYVHREPSDVSRQVGNKAVERLVEVPERQEFTDEQERAIAANIEKMFSNEKGGMNRSIFSESIGGNAGFATIDGKRYLQSASNGYVKGDGQIITFENVQNLRPGELPEHESVYEISMFNAHSNFKMVNGRPAFTKPSSWQKDTYVTRVVSTASGVVDIDKAAEAGQFPMEAARVLRESVERYNSLPYKDGSDW